MLESLGYLKTLKTDKMSEPRQTVARGKKNMSEKGLKILAELKEEGWKVKVNNGLRVTLIRENCVKIISCNGVEINEYEFSPKNN